MTHFPKRRGHLRAGFAVVTVATFLIQPGRSYGAAVDFERDVKPIFAAHCIKCHGEEKQKGKFRLDRLATMLRGGNSGEAAIVPREPSNSFLLKLIKHEETDLEMPPEGDPLTPDEIGLIERWIAEGGKTPESYGPAEVKEELTHWAFQPVERPEKAADIDSLIRRKLSENGLHPSPEADRRTLIRRLYLVMLGIPPTPEQVDAFAGDGSERAWRNLVEKVLSSPHYGERWAGHWLDLVRFGETHGFEMNRERPTAWHYRDWVIESFNSDKPYDAFVREQIAGDALGVEIGTGFLVAGPVDQVKGQDPKLRQMQRMNELDDIINTTGTAFLGLTTGCARCHNHKFDPISQSDYYSMQAVFAGVQHGDRKLLPSDEDEQQVAKLEAKITENTTSLKRFIPEVGGGAARPALTAKHNVETFPPRDAKIVRFTIEETNAAQPCIDELEIFSGGRNVALSKLGAKASSSGDFQHPLHKLAHINDGEFGNAKSWISAQDRGGWVQIELPEKTKIDRIEWSRDREGKYADRLAVAYRIETSVGEEKWQPLVTSADRQPPGTGAPSQPKYDFSGHSAAVAEEGKRLLEELEAAEAKKSEIGKGALVYAGKFAQPGATHRLYRGEPDAKREEVRPGAISSLVSLDLPADAPEQRRRVAFANWVASEANPLTARVIANRIWQFHFGMGIVDTPSDFGRNGVPPSHPELLDWLAAELVANGWSLKHLHRVILMSETWRQDSRPDGEAMRIDAGSRLLWRFPTRRLEAEGIRDSILSASGVLDLEKRGGPGFSPFEVQMENVRHYHAKKQFGPGDWRRMIYMTKVRQEKEHVFGAFDCPDASMVVPKRSRSTTPLQALNLLNSSFVMQQAGLFAKRLELEAASMEGRVDRAWRLCFQRPPTSAELSDSIEFIRQEGLIPFARALLNTNEFVFIP